MNEEMQGMAAMGVPQGQPQQAMQMTVQQVVDAIIQGANPEDLLKMGVPQELIDQAMMILMEQTQPQGQEGLAGMQVTQNDRPMRM